MLHKVWVFLSALVFLRASAFSRGLEETDNAKLRFHRDAWFNNEDQLIMLLLQSLSLRWTCQALIWSLCGKCNQCYTYHRWLGLIEALEWMEHRVCLMFSKKAETFVTWHLKHLGSIHHSDFASVCLSCMNAVRPNLLLLSLQLPVWLCQFVWGLKSDKKWNPVLHKQRQSLFKGDVSSIFRCFDRIIFRDKFYT